MPCLQQSHTRQRTDENESCRLAFIASLLRRRLRIDKEFFYCGLFFSDGVLDPASRHFERLDIERAMESNFNGQQHLLRARASAKEKLIAHGKYLVESTAPCGDCHTLRNQRGELVREKALQGAPILFKPTVWVPEWVDRAPNIAGLPGR